jgi:hypothetical protein
MPRYLRFLLALTAAAVGTLLIQFWLYDPPHGPPFSVTLVIGLCLFVVIWGALEWLFRRKET